ncbi:MAG: SGNH/GDSL hydrolase family protein [Patescibacteria group bacterium]
MTRKTFFQNLALLTTTLLLLFFAGEIFFRFYSVSPNKDLKLYKNSDLVTFEHKPNATAIHGPDGFGPDHEAFSKPQVRINNLGLRGPNTTVGKPENTIRVALFGDSFTYGMIVDQEKIFSKLLQDRLNNELSMRTGKKYEVLNFGIVGQTVDQYYVTLKNKAFAFSPDIVIVNYFAGNDASEFRRHEWITNENGELIKVKDILHYANENGELLRLGVEKPISQLISNVVFRGKLLLDKVGVRLKQPRILWSNFLNPEHPWGDPEISNYYEKANEMLLKIKELNDDNDIETLVTIIPADFQVNEKYLSKYPGNPYDEPEFDLTMPQRIVGEFTTSHSIPTLDLLPIFKKDPRDLYWLKNDPHFTEEGHEVMAETLFNYVKSLY